MYWPWLAQKKTMPTTENAQQPMSRALLERPQIQNDPHQNPGAAMTCVMPTDNITHGSCGIALLGSFHHDHSITDRIAHLSGGAIHLGSFSHTYSIAHNSCGITLLAVSIIVQFPLDCLNSTTWSIDWQHQCVFPIILVFFLLIGIVGVHWFVQLCDLL